MRGIDVLDLRYLWQELCLFRRLHNMDRLERISRIFCTLGICQGHVIQFTFKAGPQHLCRAVVRRLIEAL